MREELIKHNRDTFLAEEGQSTMIDGIQWEEFLRGILAENFQLRRATRSGKPNQNREAMIQHIKDHASDRRKIDEETLQTWPEANLPESDLGVVTCILSLGESRFQNVKVFQKSTSVRGGWQCVYWQVTEIPTA